MKKEKIVSFERALSVKCDIIKINDKTLSFVVEANRLRSDSVEYFPNSEHIRLLIFDNSGKKRWQSNDKIVFFSVVSKPLPDTIGKTYKYNIDWYGYDNNKNLLATGKYKAQVILTCLPKPYIMDMEFDWENPYD